MKILDSDHCVALLRGQLDLRNYIKSADNLAVTCISVGELTHGAHKSLHPIKNLARLDVLLAGLILLPFDAAAAQQFGQLKAWLEQQGAPLANLDLQIASIALVRQTPLVTHNYRHFERIPALQLEDWLE